MVSKAITSVKSSESRGVAILFRKDLDFEIVDIEKDNMGNILLLSIVVDETKFCLCVIYGPNTDTPDFYKNLKIFC